MERLSGITLRNEMASGPLPPGRVVMVVREMLTALRAAHLHGVLHREHQTEQRAPPRRRAYQADRFRYCQRLEPRPSAPGQSRRDDDRRRTRHPGYLAPERAAGLPASVQSDLYSVGAVMVEALTGTRVAAGTDLPDGLPSVLHRVVGRAMAIDPKSRFESADAMLDALQAPSDRAGVTTQIINAPVVPAPPATSNATRTAAAPLTDPVRTARTAALTEGPVSAPPRRRKLWTVLALTGAAACSLIASLFVLLEGGAQTTGRGVPPSSRAHVASTPTVVTTSTTTTTTATTTTTLVTTTTVPKPHHGNSPLHQLHEERATAPCRLLAMGTAAAMVAAVVRADRPVTEG